MQDLNSEWDEMEARFSGIEDRLITAEGKLTALSGMQKLRLQAQETILELALKNNAQDQFSQQIIWKFQVYSPSTSGKKTLEKYKHIH